MCWPSTESDVRPHRLKRFQYMREQAGLRTEERHRSEVHIGDLLPAFHLLCGHPRLQCREPLSGRLHLREADGLQAEYRRKEGRSRGGKIQRKTEAPAGIQVFSCGK